MPVSVQDLTRDADDYYNFHEVQRAIEAYREERIKSNKLVYPKVTSGEGGVIKKKNMLPLVGETGAVGSRKAGAKHPVKRKGKVSSSVACGTMFQFNKGQTNPDVIKQVPLADAEGTPMMIFSDVPLPKITPACFLLFVDQWLSQQARIQDK